MIRESSVYVISGNDVSPEARDRSIRGNDILDRGSSIVVGSSSTCSYKLYSLRLN